MLFFKRQTMFLTKLEIERLTGCKLKAKQCEHLKAQHIPFRLNARQEPIVTIAYINGVKEPTSNQNWQPNLKLVDSR
jgi:Domain of unknown function (DUF4224)